MSPAWHRAEPRDVRPFFETIDAEAALDDSGIVLFADGEESLDTGFDLEDVDFQKLEISLRPVVADLASWLPDGFAAVDLELVLIARNTFLKRSETLLALSLDKPVPANVPITPETLAKFGGGRNVQLILAVCLAADRPAVPGAPFVTGHWIARKLFLIRSRTQPTLFDVQTRTDEAWIAAGFPPKTFYAVDYAGGIAGEMEDGSSVATVYIHADAHAKMTASAFGEALQPILTSEIVTSIVEASLSEWKDLQAIVPTSPLATLAKQLGGDEPLSLDTLRTLASDPARLRANLQDRLSIVRGLK